MRIAMIGTRGVPASYGGFETAVEEIGSRMVDLGHEVVVYCRSTKDDRPPRYRGMDLVHLPALRLKTLETLSRTAFSVAHLTTHRKPDVAFVFNAANSPFVPIIRANGVPSAVHVDGLEWKRSKWNKAGRRYYQWAEEVSVRQADALIADAQGISDYYRSEFDVATELISYGAPIDRNPASNRLDELALAPKRFHLVVARFEPENHVDLIVDGYLASDAKLPLVVVGSAPYSAKYTSEIKNSAAADSRIKLVGAVYDQELLDQLYGNAASYFHGHSVGGTNPSLLRAMGSGAPIAAWDVSFNREVAGTDAWYFGDARGVAEVLALIESDPATRRLRGEAMVDRAEARYNWTSVADEYLGLAERLRGGYSTRGVGHRRTTLVGKSRNGAKVGSPPEHEVQP
jgi:glycosyltransferase involved in cell wall biosynthesis